MEPLEAGVGICPAAALLSIRPTRAAIDLGAVADVVHATLNAVHHGNRHGGPDNRLAVALPGLHRHRNRVRPGLEVVVFGSELGLERLVALQGIAALVRRGMVEPMDPVPAWLDPGEPGTAFLRTRAAARRSPGAVRRARERAARRGITMPDHIEEKAPDTAALALHYGPAVVHVRAAAAPVTDTPLMVNTYGFSSPLAPAVLPILLDPPRPVADSEG